MLVLVMTMRVLVTNQIMLLASSCIDGSSPFVADFARLFLECCCIGLGWVFWQTDSFLNAVVLVYVGYFGKQLHDVLTYVVCCLDLLEALLTE